MSERSFLLPRDGLVRSTRIIAVHEYLEDLPMNRTWRVLIEAAKSERSLQQNKYLFGVAYKLIGEHLGWEKQDIHEDCLKKHFGARLKKVPPSRECPDGWKEVPVRTTTTDEEGRRCVLGKMEFAEFVDFVQRYGMEVGVYIPAPNEEPQGQERAA